MGHAASCTQKAGAGQECGRPQGGPQSPANSGGQGDLAHCADGKTEAQRGEGAPGAEDEKKECGGAPESLEGLLVALPKPSTCHAESPPPIPDSTWGRRCLISDEENRDPCQVLQLGSSRGRI